MRTDGEGRLPLATHKHITHQHQAKPSLSTKSKNQDEKSREKPANANPSQTPKVKRDKPSSYPPARVVYSAGTSTLCATPSASPLLTFLPVLAIVLSTLEYGSDSSATTVAVWVSSETS